MTGGVVLRLVSWIYDFLTLGVVSWKLSKLHVFSSATARIRWPGPMTGRVRCIIWRRLVEVWNSHFSSSNTERTPIHASSSRGIVEVARFLIERGADATVRHNEGR